MINFIEKVRLGDTDQWIVARGRKGESPLLLFFHGGPGCPQTGAQHKFNRELEEHFIVVNWDQRGAGKSYHPAIPVETMKITQLLSDAKVLIDYLLEKFNKEKTYVMGHSMGALFGMLFIHQHPEVVYAFVGVNQPVHLIESEKRSYEYVIKKSKEKRHKKAIRELERIRAPINGTYEKVDDLVTQRKWLTKFGGVTYKKHALLINLHCLLSSHFTWKERLNFMKGFAFTSTHMWEEYATCNLFERIKEVQVPVYFIHGEYDRIVGNLAVEYSKQLKGPKVELEVFEKSGHLACFEEPERFNRFLIERVLNERSS